MNYNQYSNPKATQASRNLAVATLILALLGIIAAVLLMMKEQVLPALGVMIVVAAFVLGRGQIEARIVGRIGAEDPDSTEDIREAASRNKAGDSSGKES